MLFCLAGAGYAGQTVVPSFSVANFVKTSDFLFEVSKGNVPGHYAVSKFGSSKFIQTSLTDVWDRDSTPWLAPTDARVHQIASTSVEDIAVTGDGARTIRIWGLPDWDTKEVSEDIDMDGQDDVATDPYVIIHRMKVLTTGSTGLPANAGLIEATAGADGTVTAQIAVPKGQTQMAIMGVPSTQTFYMSDFHASIAHTSASPAVSDSAGVVLLQSTDIANNKTSYLFKHTIAIQDDGSTSIAINFNPPKVFEGPCIIKLAMVASIEDAFCDASFDGVLVDN